MQICFLINCPHQNQPSSLPLIFQCMFYSNTHAFLTSYTRVCFPQDSTDTNGLKSKFRFVAGEMVQPYRQLRPSLWPEFEPGAPRGEQRMLQVVLWRPYTQGHLHAIITRAHRHIHTHDLQLFVFPAIPASCKPQLACLYPPALCLQTQAVMLSLCGCWILLLAKFSYPLSPFYTAPGSVFLMLLWGPPKQGTQSSCASYTGRPVK